MAQIPSMVLYVEDEEMDRFLIERAFAKAGLNGALRMVNDGMAAIHYLSGAGDFNDRKKFPLPTVVLLDLNLPEVHGFEVLKWIRSHPAFCDLPVIIFSSSERDEDQARARLHGANGFVKKPGPGWTFQDVVRDLKDKWLRPSVPSGYSLTQNASPAPEDTPRIP